MDLVGLTLLRDGRVRTPAHPGATALAHRDGVVVWVGDERGADALAAEADRVLRLEGSWVGPAFVDSHVHLAQTGLAAGALMLHDAVDRGDVLDRVAAHARRRDDAVLLAFGWDETRWPDPEPPTRDELDRACGGRPAFLARVDVHSALVNTALVDTAPGIAGADGWSAEGRVERDAHHAAQLAVDALVTAGMRREAIARALRASAAAGIGAVHEVGAPHLSRPDDFVALDAIAEREPVPDVVRYWGEAGAYDLAVEHGLRGLAGDLCVDGAVGSRTCALHDDFTDRPGHRGFAYLDAAQVRDHLVGCTRAGLQAGFHVIGDRAVTVAAEGLALAADVLGVEAVRAARHRLEHVELPAPAEIALLGRLGVVASVQPAFDAAWGGPDGLYALRLGPGRAGGMNPLADLRDAGVALAFGSDSPVTPLEPWQAVRAAVQHRTPAQRITPEQAYAAHTAGGRWAAGEDASGDLVVGAPATYACWEIAAAASDRAGDLPDLLPGLPLPRCRATVVRGRVLHDPTGWLR